MVAITNTGILVNFDGRKVLTNICITPNGTRIASIGHFYFKVNSSNTVSNRNTWYVGTEHDNNNSFELWQSEKLVNGSNKIVESKKLIA
jgi:hypothetical protein